MNPSAKVYQHPRSPYWQAWFLAWDHRRQAWVPTTKSTKSSDKAEALGIAREFERVALAAGGQTGHVRVSRDWALDAVNSILRSAGVREVIDGKPWDAYAEDWLEMRKKRTALRTWEAYRSQVRLLTVWLGRESGLPLSAITGEQMQAWYRDMIDEGRSVNTVNNAAVTISSIFERAREEGYTPRNPVQLIDRASAAGQQREPFTAKELVKLLSFLRADPKRQEWLTVTLVGLCTGQRLSDCAAIQWTAIEHGKPYATWNMAQGKTKTKVRVPIVSPLAEHLQSLKKSYCKISIQNRAVTSLYLAPSLAGLPAGHVNGLSAQFMQILAECGIAGQHIKGKGKKGRAFNSKSFHSLRHTCNSILANAGVSNDVRIALLGHSSVTMNQRYTHLEDATTGDAMKAITRALS